MTSKSYTNRTTLWDDQDPSDPAAPQAIPARGAWRAPSAVLAGDRAGRRNVAAIPPLTVVDEDDRAPIPRRSKFAVARTPWWRPRSTFGRVLLGTGLTFVLAAFAAGAWITRQFLIRDPHFRIVGASDIQSSGLSEVNRADVLPVFGEDIGRNIFFVPLAERRRQLEQIPWIEHATVMRLLPDQIRVSIVERQPVAFVRQGGQVGLVDSNGVLLTMRAAMMAQHHYSFPVLTGIAAQDSPAAAKMRMGVYQRLLAELDGNGRRLSEQISEIDLTDPEDARVLMAEQGGDVLAHMGEDHFLDRYQHYRAHIAEWRQQYPKLASVDLRYEQQAVLQMGQGADDQQAASQEVAATGGSPAKPNASKPALETQANAGQPAKLVHARNTPQDKNSASKRTAKQSRTAARNKVKRAAEKRSAREISQQRKPQPAPVPGQGQ